MRGLIARLALILGLITGAAHAQTIGPLPGGGGGGSGTVTSVSVVSANGFAGTVATSTTTPAITLSTTITGILSGNGTAIAAASTTGSGAVVLATSPTLVTPVLGVAAATTINKVAITAPATSATLTVADGKTFTVSNTLTLAGTDGSTLTIGTGGTLGTAAYQNTGTSGATLPFLNGTNTWSGLQTAQGLTTTSPGWYAQLTGDAVPRVRVGLNPTDVASLGFGDGTNARDAFIERAAAANLRLGAPAVDTAPVAQTLSVQNTLAGGTSNVTGANFTIAGSQGKGTGVGGSILFQTAPAGSTGTAVNALATIFTINTKQILASNGGNAATPDYSFVDDPNTGVMSTGADTISLAAGGTEQVRISATLFRFPSAALVGWSSTGGAGNSSDLVLARDAANTLRQSNGVNPQIARWYGTRTDASNGDWLETSKAAGGAAYLRTVANGTGTASTLALGVAGTNWLMVTTAGLTAFGSSVAATSSFPALKRSSAILVSRLADDSANAAFEAATLDTDGFAIASLPAAGVTGRRTYVTDQLTTCAAVGVALTPGGAAICPVFDNGTIWVGG